MDKKKPCIISLGKWPFFVPFKTFVFGLKFILFYTEYQETIFSNIITSKTLLRKRLIFGQKPWTNLLGKDRFFWRSTERYLSGLKIILFEPKYKKKHLFRLDNTKKPKRKEVRLKKKTIGYPLRKMFIF